MTPVSQDMQINGRVLRDGAERRYLTGRIWQRRRQLDIAHRDVGQFIQCWTIRSVEINPFCEYVVRSRG